jgi:hypothetical protein
MKQFVNGIYFAVIEIHNNGHLSYLFVPQVSVEQNKINNYSDKQSILVTYYIYGGTKPTRACNMDELSFFKNNFMTLFSNGQLYVASKENLTH